MTPTNDRGIVDLVFLTLSITAHTTIFNIASVMTHRPSWLDQVVINSIYHSLARLCDLASSLVVQVRKLHAVALTLYVRRNIS